MVPKNLDFNIFFIAKRSFKSTDLLLKLGNGSNLMWLKIYFEVFLEAQERLSGS